MKNLNLNENNLKEIPKFLKDLNTFNRKGDVFKIKFNYFKSENTTRKLFCHTLNRFVLFKYIKFN